MQEPRRRTSPTSRWALVILGLTALTGCRSMESQPPVTTPELAVADITTGSNADYAWVQYDRDGAASARAIVESTNAACPTITVDGNPPAAMTPRANTHSAFSGITVCEYPLTPPVSSVAVSGAPSLAAPSGGSDNILVVGDTGCRLKHGKGQWCAGGSLAKGMWGFPKLAGSAAAGATKPDFSLHVGDYLYRESTDPSDDTKCSPYDPSKGWAHCGYNWATWEDDFFAPAQAGGLLARAPWIFVRGNHEGCNRAWRGYFLFFYPGAPPTSCGSPNQTIPPYPVNLTELDVWVVDSSDESSSSATTSFGTVAGKVSAVKASWLTTHVPTFDLGTAYQNSDLCASTGLKWIHVGHVHNFEHFPAAVSRQAETITGGSGTALDSCPGTAACSATSPDDCCLGKSTSPGAYSFLRVQHDTGAKQWNAVLYDVDGAKVHDFSVPEARTPCTPVVAPGGME